MNEGISKVDAEKIIQQYLLEVYPDRFEPTDNKYHFVIVILGAVLMIGVLVIIFLEKNIGIQMLVASSELVKKESLGACKLD